MQRMSAPNIAGAHLPQHARGYWKARFDAAREGAEAFLERERGQLPIWLVIGFGAFRLLNHRHPRALARIRPTQLGLWSFAVAIAHGAGLMLVPIYLGLCQAADVDAGHAAAGRLINSSLGMAVLVSVAHSVAMIAAGGCAAWLVYRYLGLKFVARSWFNLDAVWAVSLIVVGAIALLISLADGSPT